MTKIELIDWMICDDLRREDSGKLIYIGVYPTNEIIIGNSPMIIPKLVVSTKWKTDNNLIKYEFKVIAPDSKIVVEVNGELAKTEKERKVSFLQFVISPFKIEGAGDYKIEGTINNKKYEIGSFQVGLHSV